MTTVETILKSAMIKWYCMTYPLVEQDIFSLPEHLSSPQSVHVLIELFILSNYMSMSSRFRSVMYYDTFFFPFICFSFIFRKFMLFFNVICMYWCSTWFSCQMMFMSFNSITISNTTGSTNGEGTDNPSGRLELISGFVWGLCCSIFVDHCLSFVFNLLRITPSDYPLWYIIHFLNYKKTLTAWKCLVYKDME